MRWRDWEPAFLDLVKGKRKGPVAALLCGLLWLLSFPYRFVVFVKNWAYQRGWLLCYHPPVPLVVSVGNITVGGSGKTPLVLLLAQQFAALRRVAILSRGYRSSAEKLSSPVMLCKEEGKMFLADYCGDEPYLLADNVPNAMVVVGRDRCQAANLASKAGAKLIILDDGMQYRRLARDIEIVVLQGADPFGQGYLLPRGLLREELSALGRADLIVVMQKEGEELTEALRSKIGCHSKAPIVEMVASAATIYMFQGEELSSLAGKRVGLFCGIAAPERFEAMVSSLGAEVVASETLPDHTVFDTAGLDLFAKRSEEAGAELLICTEKDKVKLPESLHLSLPLAWVQMELQVVRGAAHWEALLERIQSALLRRM